MTDVQINKIHESIGLIHKNLECSVCLEILQDPVSTKCGHQFCRFCILAVLQTKPSAPCPLCKKLITKRGLTENERLKQIVAAVNNVTTAIEEDSGTKCTPPRGAVILSQVSQPTASPHQPVPPKKKQKKTTVKKNLRKSKSKCTDSLEIFIDANEDVDDSEIQEPCKSNTNISTSFPAPTSKSIKSIKNNEKQDGLLVALKVAPLRPTSQVNVNQVDPYEFIPSQRTPRKKPKRKEKRKATKHSKTITKQRKETRKAGTAIVVYDIDVHTNDENDTEVNLNIDNEVKNQLNSRTSNQVCKKTAETICTESKIQEGEIDANIVYIKDPKPITDQITDNEGDIHKCNGNDNHSIVTDVLIDENDQCGNKEKDISDVLDDDSEDWQRTKSVAVNENKSVFRKVYTIKRRKSNSPENKKGESSAMSNSADEDDVVVSKNDIVTRRKKMQESLKKFGKSEESTLKHTRRSVKKLDKTDWEIALELAQEFGTLPKELTNKRHSLRKLKPEVNIQGVAKCSSTEKSKPRKSKGRKTLLSEDGLASDEQQIQEYSDSYAEMKTFPPTSDHVNKRDSELKANSITEAEVEKTITKGTNCKATEDSPQVQTQPKVVPETPVIAKEKSSKLARDTHPEVENPNIHTTTKVKRRSKKQSLVNSPRQNNCLNSDCKNNNSGRSSRSNSDLNYSQSDQSSNLGNDKCSTNANCPVAEDKIHHCSLSEKRSQIKVVDTLESGPSDNELSTSCIQDLNNESSKHILAVKETNLETMQEVKKIVDRCQDETGAQGDTTDSIELSVSDIEYEEPSIEVAKDFENDDESCVENIPQKETSDEVCHQTTNHIATIVSDAECLEMDQDSSNLPEAILVSQSSEGSKKKVKRSLRSAKKKCGNLLANKEDAKKERTTKLEQTAFKNGSDTNEQLQDGIRQEVRVTPCAENLDVNKIPLEISEDCVKTIQNRKNNCKKSPASNNILTLPAEKSKQDRVLPCPDYSHIKTPETIAMKESVVLALSPEPQKKPRRSKRKTFTLGNTPEKIEDALTSMNTPIKDPISDSLRHSDMDFDSEKSMYKSASELFDSKSPSEVAHLDLNEASKECSNIASKKTTESLQSQDCIIPSSIELKTNSDVFSGSDELSSISTKRKSRSRGSQSSRRSQRLSEHSSSFSLNEQSKTMLNKRDFKQVVKDAVSNEVMMSNSDQLSPVKMTQRSTESFLGSNISSKIDSSNNKMSCRRNKKSTKEAVETTQPGTDEVIPGSKGESQTSSNITPPIIDYRPVMKKKRLALKSRKVAEKTNDDNCETKTIDIDNKKAQEEIKETATQLKEAKERNPPNNSTPKHYENSDTKTMHSDTKNNDKDNSEFQMDKEVNDDLGSFKETVLLQEVEKRVSDCSSDEEDDDSVIPPTPNQNHSVANTTNVTKFSKNIFPVKKIAVVTVEGNNKNLRIESSVKEDDLLTGGNCTSQESESNSLSVFQVIDQQKVQLISPLVSAEKNVQRQSQVNRVKDSQEFSEKRDHDMLVEEIDKNMKVDEYQEDILTPELLESDVPTQSSHSSETLVEGCLYSDNDNCSEDECFPLQNANSVSSLLSSQAEILNTQQRETAKEEMERIAKQIKEMETEMAEKKLAEDIGIEDVTEITMIDEDFNPEGLSDSDCEIVETGVSAGGVKQLGNKKASQKKQKVAKGRSRILRPTVDSDTDDEDIETLEIETNKEKESVFINLDADVIEEDDDLISGCKATPQSSNSCLKSLSQSLFHSPRSPSPPPSISAELLLEKSPLELQEKLSSIHSIVQEYKGSQRKRKVIGDAFSQPQTTPKRPRVMETDNPVTAPSENARSVIEHTPVKMKKNYSFVATGLTRAELKQVEQLANKCGFPFASKFNNNTTHVIVKTDLNLVCERTLKYFLGIAGKKWIVSYKWILNSLDMGYLLSEDEYEVIGDVASGTNHMGPKRSRMQKTSLLEGYDICCIGEFTMLTKEQLAQLLELTGVTKVSHPTMFSFNPDCKALIIAQSDVDKEPINFKSLFRKFRVPVISREWILDSIAPSAIQPLDDYLLCDVPQNVLEKY